MCDFSVVGPINSGVAVGGAGVATANATSTNLVKGQVMAVYVKYNDTPPAGTTDVTVVTAGSSGAVPAQTILSLANQATDIIKYPSAQICGTDGALIAAEYTPIVIYDNVKVTIAQADAADSVDVWLIMRE